MTKASLTYRATVEAAPLAAVRIAEVLDEVDDPSALSVSFFELGTGTYEVSALYGNRPDKTALEALIEAAADSEPVMPLTQPRTARSGARRAFSGPWQP